MRNEKQNNPATGRDFRLTDVYGSVVKQLIT
jgi:hypothetical protein